MLQNRIFSIFYLFIFLYLLMLSTTVVNVVSHLNNSDHAILIRIEAHTSLIDIPTQEFVSRALKQAEDRNVPLIIYLDTYGGYLDPALNIAKMLLESKVPVIVYVKDKAYSAGTLIALASHILAMRNTAVIGAAQPITINPVTGEIVFLNETKVINPIIKTLEICANLRNRNSTIVKRFVYENLVLTGEEALNLGVIDFTANSLDELINILRGVELNISGTIWRLKISRYEELNPDIDLYVMIFLRNSIVNSILFFIGLFGTMALILSGRLELLPITIVFLLLALVGSEISSRIISLLLITLGSILLFVELFILPGFGITGISGIIALVAGILLTPLPTGIYTTSIVIVWRAVLISASTIGALFIFILYKVIKTARKPKSIAYAPERKTTGKAIDRISPTERGYVTINGELWIAESNEVIEPGEEIEVIERKGLTVKVRKKREE